MRITKGELLLNALLVMLGGGLGALCRYGVNLLSVRIAGTHFPAGTLAVNLTGCLLIGLVFGISERTALIGPQARLFLATGFLGALTTFSSFAVETVAAAQAGQTQLALINILANNLLCLALVVVGMLLSRHLA